MTLSVFVLVHSTFIFISFPVKSEFIEVVLCIICVNFYFTLQLFVLNTQIAPEIVYVIREVKI